MELLCIRTAVLPDYKNVQHKITHEGVIYNEVARWDCQCGRSYRYVGIKFAGNTAGTRCSCGAERDEPGWAWVPSQFFREVDALEAQLMQIEIDSQPTHQHITA